MYVISRARNNIELGYDTFTKLYEACVVPILDYACGAWGTGGTHPKIDMVQHRAIRYHCGLPKMTPLAGLIGEMGWTPRIVQRDIETLRFYNQLIAMVETRLTHKMLQYDSTKESGEWSNNVKKLLASLEMSHCWELKS